MKRQPSLRSLSEHHHHALVQALQVRRAQQAPATRRAAALRQAARAFLRFWKRTGRKHFREEEEVLLPAYARRIPLTDDPSVVQMLADHAAIRGQVEELVAALAARRTPEAEIVSLARLLHDHVRLEENQVFPRIEAALDEEELLALCRRLTRLHSKKSS